MEEKKITAGDFLKGLSKMEDHCASCKFFDHSKGFCKEHNKEVKPSTIKCDRWRYFA